MLRHPYGKWILMWVWTLVPWIEKTGAFKGEWVENEKGSNMLLSLPVSQDRDQQWKLCRENDQKASTALLHHYILDLVRAMLSHEWQEPEHFIRDERHFPVTTDYFPFMLFIFPVINFFLFEGSDHGHRVRKLHGIWHLWHYAGFMVIMVLQPNIALIKVLLQWLVMAMLTRQIDVCMESALLTWSSSSATWRVKFIPLTYKKKTR